MAVWSIGPKTYDTADEAQLGDLLARLVEGAEQPLTHKTAGFRLDVTPASFIATRQEYVCRTTLEGTFLSEPSQTADGQEGYRVERNELTYETKAYISAPDVPYDLVVLARAFMLRRQIHSLLRQAEDELGNA